MSRLTHIEARPGFQLWLEYSDGQRGLADVSDVAGQGVFALWNEPGAFARVQVGEFGQARWTDEVELCPDALRLRLADALAPAARA
jgi:Protein of unknown function (DUF2442)